MPGSMIETNLARALARKAGAFCLLNGDGSRLVFYRGDINTPSTWKEFGSTLTQRELGYFTVSRQAVERILTPPEKKRRANRS